KLGARLLNEPEKPWNTVHLCLLGGQVVHRDHMLAWNTVHLDQEVVPTDGRGQKSRFVIRFPVSRLVIDKIEQLLRGAANRGQKFQLVFAEELMRIPYAALIAGCCFVIHCPKLEGPVIFTHSPLS